MSEIGFIDDDPFKKDGDDGDGSENDDNDELEAKQIVDGDDDSNDDELSDEMDDSDDDSDDNNNTDDNEIEVTQIQINESDLAHRIPDTSRRSYNLLTKFEKVRVINARAEQIARGSPPNVKTTLTCPIEIAEEELNQNVIPIRVRRPIMVGTEKKYEEWDVKDLIHQ